jgi:hypothetical protein
VNGLEGAEMTLVFRHAKSRAGKQELKKAGEIPEFPRFLKIKI